MSIDHNPIRTSVLAVLHSFDINTNDVTDDSRLEEDLDVDSTLLIAVVAEILGQNHPDGKSLKQVRTVGDLVAFLARTPQT